MDISLCKYIYIYIELYPFSTLAVSFLRSLLSELRQTSQATCKLAGVAPRHLSPCCRTHAISFFSSHPNAVLLQSCRVFALAVSSLQSLLSEPLLIANMLATRTLAGSKQAG